MTTTTIQGNGHDVRTQAFNDLKDSFRLLPDQRERWHNVPKNAEPMTFERAAEIIRTAAREDGERQDVGAGALDKIAVDIDKASGQLVMIKTEQRGGQIVPASAPVTLRRNAFVQLCARAKAPSEYLSRIPARLARACLQHGMIESGADKDGLIRLAGGEARAVVSARYAPLDDTRILDALDTVLTRHGMRNDVRVRGVAVGPTTVLRLTIPTGATPIKVGDVVEAGLDLLNGELGNRSVQIDPSVYRLICLNGMRGWSNAGDSRRLRHIGNPERLAEALYDAIPAALNDATGQINQLRKAADRVIEDVADEFNLFTGSLGMTQSETQQVARQVFAERAIALPAKADEWGDAFKGVTDLTAYDVLNGITAYAQTRGTDRRLELEEAASGYLRRRVS
jgi:hypothetical protein